MKKYKKLNLELRYKIEALLESGKNKTEIASIVEVHKSTISRELSRNTPTKGKYAFKYRAEYANAKAIEREQNKPRHRRFTMDQLEYIRDKIKTQRWSPELVSRRGSMELGDFISHEWIYQYIWTAKHSNHSAYKDDKGLHKYLKHFKRRSKRRNTKGNRGCIPNRVGIDQRPKAVNDRTRYGDYEVDFMMGKNHKPGLIVMTDRATLMTKLIKTNSKMAKLVEEKIITKMKAETSMLKTATFDNDLGFSSHEQVAKELDIKTYFTRPYTSQDKGTVENRIGVIRRFFPKGMDMEQVHHSTIKSVENKLNNRPVRKFNYLTPIEKYSSLVALDT